MEKEQSILLRFTPKLDLPIYLKLNSFKVVTELLDFFKRFHFEAVSTEEIEKHEHIIKNDQRARVLQVTLASEEVGRFLLAPLATDSYSCEVIIPKEGYNLYRSKGVAMLVYSYRVGDWSIGVSENFAKESHSYESRLVMTRYLSWALAPLGVVGFWGVPIESGMIVSSSIGSQGEPVFIDILKSTLISFDGISSLGSEFGIVRLDEKIQAQKKMSKEELAGFLSHHCTYLDPDGLSTPVRQVIRKVTFSCFGIVVPKETFTSKGPDLSL